MKTVKSIIAGSGIPSVVKRKNKTGVHENHKKGQNCTDCNSRNCKAASFFRTFIALTKSDNGQNKSHDAEQAEKQLSSLSERQAELLEQTRAEQNRLIQQASRERERIIESAKAQAQAEADKILQNAKNEIRAEKQSALRDLSALVSSLSVQVAEKIVRHKLETDPQEQIKLIDGLIEEASHLNDSTAQRKA